MPNQRPETGQQLLRPGNHATVPELTPERWQQVKDLFAAAQERDPSDRSAFLLEICGSDDSLRAEVESLLAVAESDPAISDSHDTLPALCVGIHTRSDLLIGQRIGSYKIEKQLGRGGMATVYLASRADEAYEKQVAIKVLLPELDSDELLRRFRSERQTLAALDHPNIVKLLDGGTTKDGLPYLVMDYVEGDPIDEYCDNHKLSTENRLRLFREVCLAVQYAHEHHVVHRDLKPSNILVTTQGIPKLLDFGISKVLEPADKSQAVITQTRTRRLTPAYASPEQVKAVPITAATDVYSLGVVLYELLTGHRPYKLKQHTPAEIERAICEEDPEKPSTAVHRIEADTSEEGATVTKTPETVSRTREGSPDKLRRCLRGDLDTILLMALQKEPQRRYTSALALSEDIERHLNHKPVLARPSSVAYRASKFVRRRKTEMLAFVAVTLILAGAIGFSAWQHRRADQIARAEIAAQRSGGRRSVAVLGFKNLSARPDKAWISTALAEMLTTELSAGGRLRTISGENVAQTRINLSLPEADSFSQQTLSRLYKNMGSDLVVVGSYLDMGDSDRSIRLDLRVQDAALGETLASLAETGNESSLADLVTRSGVDLRARLGISEISPAESAGTRAAFASDPESARFFAEGIARLRVFDSLGARDQLQRAVAADPSFALAHSALAEAWSALGYDARAVEEARKASEIAGNLPREQHLWIEGRYEETSGHWSKAADAFRTLFNFFPDNLEYGLHLAKAEIEAGELDESQKTIEALRKQPPMGGRDARIDIMEADLAQNRTDYNHELEVAVQAQRKAEAMGARLLIAQALYIQGHALRLVGDLHKSIVQSTQARQMFASAGDHFREARALGMIGNASIQANDLPTAEKNFQEALAIYTQIGNKSAQAGSLMGIANVHLFQRDFVAAIDFFQKSMALSREVDDSAAVAVTQHNLALAEEDQGQLARARHDFEQVLPVAQHNNDKGLIAGCLINLSHIVAAQGDMPRARKLAADSVEVRRHTGSKPRLGEVLVGLGDLDLEAADLRAAQGHFSEAQKIFNEAKQDFRGSAATYGLGDILMARGDLVGARKSHEQVLAIRQKEHGHMRELFDSRIRVAELFLEDGKPADAEAALRQTLMEYSAQGEPQAKIEADEILIHSLIAQGKVSLAQEIVTADVKLASGSEDLMNRVTINILNAELLTASGQASQAINSLQDSVEKCKQGGFGQLELEARLALGEAEIKSGHSATGRAQLASLERDARAKGFLLIARKAAARKKADHSSNSRERG